jgi:peptidylprolyl isomerase
MESCAAFFSFKEDQKMKAELGCFIRVHYTGKLKDATVFATTEMNEPLEFTLGNHEVLPQIEEAVLNMEVGETKTIHITAEEAFGPAKKSSYRKFLKNFFRLVRGQGRSAALD